MLGGELSFHFLNVMLMTALVAPLVLWRYRRAVLAGMQSRLGSPLPIAPAHEARPRPRAAAPTSVAAALAWEARLRRRILVAALAALAVPALLLALQYLALAELPVTPVNVVLSAGTTLLMAVPIFAVLTATPFWRALRLGILVACVVGAVLVALSMLQRAWSGKAPTLDQAMNFVEFAKFAAIQLSLPLVLGAILSVRRIRGVAPFVFAGLLVFALAPVLGVRLTQALLGMQWSAGWTLRGGIHGHLDRRDRRLRAKDLRCDLIRGGRKLHFDARTRAVITSGVVAA